MKTISIGIVIALSFLGCSAQDTLHFMSYNLLNYYGSVQDTATRNPYFRTIISATRPDIITTAEINNESSSFGFLNGVLKKVDSNYSGAPFIPGPDTNNSLYFLSDKYSCNSNTAIHTALRDINHYILVQLQTNDTVHVFALHLKAGSGIVEESTRLAEVNELRLVTDALPVGASFIICGDFNFYNSTESAYQRLKEISGTNEGHVIDPINITGTWNNSNYTQYHTQSPRTRSFGGGITGGLDDRFDMILFSKSINTNGPLRFIPNSTIAYGNDGNHFNDSINRQPNTAVSISLANALHHGADHLPVLAKFVFINGWAAGISNKSVDNNPFIIYPNPTSGGFKIQNSSGEETGVDLYDLTGKLIWSESFVKEKTIFPLNISSGIYYVKVSNKNEIRIFKLVVEK